MKIIIQRWQYCFSTSVKMFGLVHPLFMSSYGCLFTSNVSLIVLFCRPGYGTLHCLIKPSCPHCFFLSSSVTQYTSVQLYHTFGSNITGDIA